MMKGRLELRAATIDALTEEDGEVLLACAVYVPEPDGPGRYRDAVIRVKDGVTEREELDFPVLLDGGSLALDGDKYDEALPWPLEAEGEVALLLVPAESSEFVIRGSGIEIELIPAN